MSKMSFIPLRKIATPTLRMLQAMVLGLDASGCACHARAREHLAAGAGAQGKFVMKPPQSPRFGWKSHGEVSAGKPIRYHQMVFKHHVHPLMVTMFPPSTNGCWVNDPQETSETKSVTAGLRQARRSFGGAVCKSPRTMVSGDLLNISGMDDTS